MMTVHRSSYNLPRELDRFKKIRSVLLVTMIVIGIYLIACASDLLLQTYYRFAVSSHMPIANAIANLYQENGLFQTFFGLVHQGDAVDWLGMIALNQLPVGAFILQFVLAYIRWNVEGEIKRFQRIITEWEDSKYRESLGHE
jgi:hypothetical protein